MGSFVENRFHKMFRSELPPWELAEQIWMQSQDNINKFLKTIPEKRKIGIAYENLVRRPQSIMREICVLLDIAFENQMCSPYDRSTVKMTNGIHSDSKMIGDPKFLKHTQIDPTLADSWKPYVERWEELDKRTHELATSMNYNIDEVKMELLSTKTRRFKRQH
jgi:hypothetical protein